MKFRIAGILLVLMLLSCGSKKELLYLQDLSNDQTKTIAYQDPTIQPNDILKITVESPVPEAALPYNKAVSGAMTQNIQVLQLDGYLVSNTHHIDFPVLGTIPTKGLTTRQLAEDLEQRLKQGGHLSHPTVNVRLINAKVTVLGEVKAPGTYNFTEQNITLLQALGYAGDLTLNGKRDDILLSRDENGTLKITHIDLTDSAFMASEYFYIKPNDVIIVNPNDRAVNSSGIVDIGTLLSIASLALSVTILLTR